MQNIFICLVFLSCFFFTKLYSQENRQKVILYDINIFFNQFQNLKIDHGLIKRFHTRKDEDYQEELDYILKLDYILNNRKRIRKVLDSIVDVVNNCNLNIHKDSLCVVEIKRGKLFKKEFKGILVDKNHSYKSLKARSVILPKKKVGNFLYEDKVYFFEKDINR